jgi:hypothetical protein
MTFIHEGHRVDKMKCFTQFDDFPVSCYSFQTNLFPTKLISNIVVKFKKRGLRDVLIKYI